MKHLAITKVSLPGPGCARCGGVLPDIESGEMVMGLPGVGIFHAGCKPRVQQRLLHRAHRLLTPKPQCAESTVVR